MLQSMISTGILKRAPHQPARLLINPIVNDTSSQFDVGEMTYRMREQLVNSGQAQTITAYGKYTEDEAALEEVRRRAFESGTQPDVEPDYTLSGKITQIRRNAGSTKQVTYTFRLTLTDPNTGLEVWTKTADVTKQGQKNGIGF
jgi:PBP1b-binding outer membrane lipoprotein LpoB